MHIVGSETTTATGRSIQSETAINLADQQYNYLYPGPVRRMREEMGESSALMSSPMRMYGVDQNKMQQEGTK